MGGLNAGDDGELAIDLSREFSSKITPVLAKNRRLPFDSPELRWDDFELLIARMAVHPKGAGLRGAHLFGRSGQAQQGIDVFSQDPYTKRQQVFQCKRVRHIRSGDLLDWTRCFLAGEFANTAEAFYLCLATDIESDTKRVEEWAACEVLLASRQIQPVLWQRRKLEDLLVEMPELVERLFGAAVCESFCLTQRRDGAIASRQAYREKFQDLTGQSALYENVGIHCHLSLPAQGRLHLSAALSFARDDLRGATLIIPAAVVLHWLRHVAYSGSNSARPFAVRVPGGTQYALRTPTACITLDEAEVLQLEWVLRSAWPVVQQALHRHEEDWKNLRFAPLYGDSKQSYGLVSVEAKLWRAVLAFAQAHDADDGDSEWHIFDAAPGCLKVFTKDTRLGMNPGHHLALYAFAASGIVMPWDSNLILAWQPAIWIDKSLPPQAFWDAEYTHDWLLNQLLPEVVRWKRELAIANRRNVTLYERLLKQGAPKPATEEERWSAYSLGREGARSFSVDAERLDSMQACARQLQVHFNGRFDDLPIPDRLIDAALAVVERLAPYARPLDEFYIRSKLSLPDELDIATAVREMRTSSSLRQRFAGRFCLDVGLRCASSVLDAVQSAPLHELRHCQAELRLIWERYREDLLCESVGEV